MCHTAELLPCARVVVAMPCSAAALSSLIRIMSRTATSSAQHGQDTCGGSRRCSPCCSRASICGALAGVLLHGVGKRSCYGQDPQPAGFSNRLVAQAMHVDRGHAVAGVRSARGWWGDPMARQRQDLGMRHHCREPPRAQYGKRLDSGDRAVYIAQGIAGCVAPRCCTGYRMWRS